MAIPAVIAGVAATFGAIGKLADNPLIAWFLSILVLMLDSGQAGLFGNPGAVGGAISFVINLAGLNITVTSAQLLLFVAVSPFLIFMIKYVQNN